VADLTREALHSLARLGAKARLEELRSEEAAIRKAFPDLSGGGRQAAGAGGAPARKRRPMSDEKRQEVSERMKKYWAARRKTKK
jgi:hypothetical protein